MKKILVFASYFFPHKGGSEKYIYELYKRLVKDKNFEAHIFTNNTENVSEFENIDGLKIYRVPCYHILGKTYPIPKPIASFRLLRNLKKNNYNYVNTQTRFWINSFYGYLFSKFTKTKLIHTEHGTRHTEFDNLFVKRLAEIYDHLIGSLIIKNASDQNGRPYTEERIRRAIDEIHYSFDTRPSEQQMPEVIEKLKTVIPIKVETKKVKITIPAQYTGHVYSILKDFKESEEWLPNGSLEAVLNIPAGMQIDFYDKLNSITHGAVQSKDMK